MQKNNISEPLNILSDYKKTSANEYAPKMRTDYHPNKDEIEDTTGVNFPINMPNPATDSIVVNNISSAEFDYTEDVLSPPSCKNVKK